jgi:hypothetical protein
VLDMQHTNSKATAVTNLSACNWKKKDKHFSLFILTTPLTFTPTRSCT